MRVGTATAAAAGGHRADTGARLAKRPVEVATYGPGAPRAAAPVRHLGQQRTRGSVPPRGRRHQREQAEGKAQRRAEQQALPRPPSREEATDSHRPPALVTTSRMRLLPSHCRGS